VRVRVREYAAEGSRAREDRLSTEEPLEIRLSWPGRPATRVGVTMRTPGHDFELAAGLLFAEGVLSPGNLASVAYCTDDRLAPDEEYNVVTVTLSAPPSRLPAERPATVTASASACGVCGTESIQDVLALAGVRGDRADQEPGSVPADVLRALPSLLRTRQRVFESTGGLHAAALVSAAGEILTLREDVGRHNAVDKAVGARLLAGEPTAAPVLCVSGRAGFEIAQKAVAAGVGVLAALGAPSSLAVALGAEAGLCVVGFLSGERFVVYAGDNRIR
jgi:FdhD protein